MATPSLVSVIIPAFNAGAYVGEAIRSALAQTYPSVEVLAVDDGSTDDTAEVLRGFGDRIQIIKQNRGGVSRARNLGVCESSGEWIAFLDADDVWCVEKLERQLAMAGPGVGLIYSDRLNVGDRGPLPERQGDVQQFFEGDVFVELLCGNFITNSSVVMPRDVFHRIGGFDPALQLAEDWDLWIRVSEQYSVRLCREPLLHYRFHGGMSSKGVPAMWSARRRVISRALRRQRARALTCVQRRRILSSMWATNGWDASRRGLRSDAMVAYSLALAWWPFSTALVRSMGRALLRRD